MAAHQPTVIGRISISLLAIIFGIPIGYMLIIGTWGMILVPFVVAFYAAPLFLINYLLWGRALSRKLRPAMRAGAETGDSRDYGVPGDGTPQLAADGEPDSE